MPDKKYQRPANIIDLASRLVDLGYFPVPIPSGCKGPVITEWENLRLKTEDIPEYFSKPNMLVGCLHVNLACFDIDVTDPALAEEIITEGFRRFPGALERIGRAPKSAIVMRLHEPGFTMRNTEKHKKVSENGEEFEAQVEVRTKTRQMVVYGLHPDTGKPYTWPRGQLWETPVENLPPLTEKEAQDYRDWCNERIRAWSGAQPQSATIIDLGDYQPGTFSLSGADRPAEAEFLEALSYVPASLGHESGWRDTLMAIHDFFGGSMRGLEIAKNWSSTDPRYTPREVETKWKSFEVGKGVGHRTVFHLARLNGADLSAIARKHKAQAEVARSTDPKVSSQPQNTNPQDAQKTPTSFDLKGLSRAALAITQPRKWLYGHKLIRGFCTVLGSPGGTGKSAYAAAIAVDLATGVTTLHDRPHAKLKTWVYNLEDPLDETHRKFAALAIHRDLSDEDLGRIMATSGRDRSLILAQEISREVIVASPDVGAVIDEIKSKGIDVLVVDPFVRAHRLSENDNKHIDFVMDLFAKIAHEGNCSVLLVHHSRKGFVGGDADSFRGGSSMTSAARIALTLQTMSEEEAVAFGVPFTERRSLVRIDNAKANLAPPPGVAEWIKLQSVAINNGDAEYPDGDFVQVAVKWNPPDAWDGIGETKALEILDKIKVGFVTEAGTTERFSARTQDKERWVGNAILSSFPAGEKTVEQAKQIVRTWLEKGILADTEYHSEAQRKTRRGIEVISLPGEIKP